MKSVDDYLAELLAHQPTLGALDLPLGETLGAVTAEPVLARHPIPLFDNSSMDRYAMHSADIAGAGRIVPVEQTDGGTEQVRIMGGGADFIRPVGGDLVAGTEVLPAGVRITAWAIASAASAGHGTLRVHPRPRIAVIATGTELRAPGESLDFRQIPNSNSPLVAASLAGRPRLWTWARCPMRPRPCGTCSPGWRPTRSCSPGACPWVPTTSSRSCLPRSRAGGSGRWRCSQANRKASASTGG